MQFGLNAWDIKERRYTVPICAELPHPENTNGGPDSSRCKMLLKKPGLVHKSFLNMCITSNLSDAGDHMIWSETDIKIICSDEDDKEVCRIFTAKDIAAAIVDINKLIMK